ncbi:aliphatic sulfonate ABC transporter [Listeria floridensis FSL S10-1187]|uniref:Aliphatic sulfonate ABC transporter n=1 Tax=Listeria floridensis FSL S10-1187 TaxID=1265817 RepID=A0ABP3AYI0_9LIST|nr:ABC transporter substrate-binding protein [Listeria floridensis]EUJ31392.1 aliphatic sulfonate ABC transporter [Listeria floridensis FSL S10-1187]
MKKIGILLGGLLFGMMLLAGCSGAENGSSENKGETNKDETSNETLRFGTLPAESAIPIIIAKEKGYFADEKVKVEITPFNAPNDRNVAAQAGEIDGMIGDVMTALSMRDGGIDFTITSDINEDFKLLSAPNSGITEVKQLDGKEVSLVPKFLLEYLMDEIAAKNKIDYKVVSIPSISARYEALLNDKVDSVIFTEPQASLLQKNGAHLLASSAEYGLKGGTISFKSDVVEKRGADITAFYRAYDQAVAYMNETDVSEYRDILTKYKFPESMSTYLSSKEEKYTKAAKVSKTQFNSIEKWTKKKDMIKKDYSYQEMTNFKFLGK